MKFSRTIFTCLVLTINAWLGGQEKPFTASAPATVRAGEQFQYVIEGSEQGDVTLPALEGFQLLAGPFSSYSSHSQWINGKMTMETVVTYTHILRAVEEGDLTIPPATVKVGRKEYRTNEVRISVGAGEAPAPGSGGNAPQTGGESREEGGSTQAGEVSVDPVFLRVIPSRREVYVGEQLVSGLKIYTRVNTRPASSAKDIPYEGFYKKSIDPDEVAQREVIEGQQYVTQVIQRHILIPQKPGKITIEPYESEWMVQQRVQRRSGNTIFDSFFDDPFFSGVQEVPTKLSTPPVTIRVKPLPEGAPEGFTGGVGDFTMKAELSADEVEVNEALSLKVTIQGTGNLPLLGEPKVNLPPDHDLYDVTRKLNSSTAGNRISGTMTFEYPIVARHAGRFRIAPVRFAWFDPGSETYRSVTTEEFSFAVLKGESEEVAGNVYIPGIMQESVEDIGTDIRDIVRTPPLFVPVAYTLLGKNWYRLLFPLALFATVMVIVLIRVTSRRNADIRLVRNRKANRMARGRLKKADRYRKSGEDDRFYEETGKAIWGYLADKLNIETSELSREVVSRELERRRVDPELLTEYIRILDGSEISRFAPVAEKSNIDQLYRDAVQLIRKLENKL